MNIVISPPVSQDSAFRLSESLGWDYLLMDFDKSNRDFSQYDSVFNYGFSRKIKGKNIINLNTNIKKAKDKLFCLDNVSCNKLEYTQDINVAKDWINEGYIVVVRNLIKGSNGKGLVYCSTFEDLEAQKEAKLYTKYLVHTNEYRINVYKNKILSIYDKIYVDGFFKFKLLPSIQNENKQVVELVNEVYNKVSLDWMGIDVLRTDEGVLYFLEVNSAPILFPYTINKLTKEIKNEIY